MRSQAFSALPFKVFVADTAATGQRHRQPTPSRQCRSYKITTLVKLLQGANNNVFVASGSAATGQRYHQPTPSRQCRSHKVTPLTKLL